MSLLTKTISAFAAFSTSGIPLPTPRKRRAAIPSRIAIRSRSVCIAKRFLRSISVYAGAARQKKLPGSPGVTTHFPRSRRAKHFSKPCRTIRNFPAEGVFLRFRSVSAALSCARWASASCAPSSISFICTKRKPRVAPRILFCIYRCFAIMLSKRLLRFSISATSFIWVRARSRFCPGRVVRK